MSRRAGLLPTCLLVSLLLPGCNEKPPGRALLVGIDGASMRVVGPMLEDGRLPNLAALAVSGVHGTIRSQFPIDSPPVWNSIVTGVSPKRHGIPSFAYKDEQGEKRLFLSTHRKVPTLNRIRS